MKNGESLKTKDKKQYNKWAKSKIIGNLCDRPFVTDFDCFDPTNVFKFVPVMWKIKVPSVF